MKVYPLSEGSFTVGFDKQFIPFKQDEDELNDRSRGSILVEIQPFLCLLNDDIILLDTGLGLKNDHGAFMLAQQLNDLGFNLEDVTKIALTHLHKDHVNGLVNMVDESGKSLFSHAKFYIHEKEWAYAQETGLPSYYTEPIAQFIKNNPIEWLQGAEGTICEGVRFQHSGAHAPEHIVFTLTDGDDIVFFGGDEAPQYRQMIFRYVAKYDKDGKKAANLREAWKQDSNGQWTFLFYHDIKKPMAKL
jgi:glyoxylase-like metal-dependent hydrolase (beta-lactamase superfamily II)